MIQYLHTTTAEIENNYPNSTIIIGGDFNRLNLEDVEMECGLTILDSPPTRHDACLDLIFANRSSQFKNISTFKSVVETHHLGVLLKPLHKTPPVRRSHTFRLFTYQGHRDLNNLLSNFDFSHAYTIEDVHEATIWLESSIKWCFETAFPIKSVTMSSKDPFWFTPKTRWLLKKKKQAHRKHQLAKEKMFNDRIKDVKIQSLKQCGSKAWWENIDSITHRKVTHHKINENAFEPNKLNVELASRSAFQTHETREPSPLFDLEGHQIPQLSLNEVAHVIKSCKRTSSGPNNIPQFIFGDYWDILTPLYHHVWNKSLAIGEYPKVYKLANLIPLPKVSNAKTTNDVRGISVTSISARLFEKAVHRKWITPRIISIGDPHRFAYKARLSTSDCLLRLQHYVLSALDRSDIDGVHVFMIDFAKAFDRVNQEKAAVSYVQFIDSPHIRKWLYDFSVNRKQRLIWREQPLEYLDIDRGCSQGTVGGPGIFSMYTNDARNIHSNTKILKYSDDMNCLIPCLKNPSYDDKTVFANEISHLIDWAKRKDLDINLRKSKLIRFCLNRLPHCACSPPILNFETVQHAKILGVIFQSDCSFRKHCTKLLSELRSLSFLLKDLQLHHVSLNDIQAVFESIMISKVRYGLSIYGSDRYSLQKINKFLNRCYEKRFCKIRYDVFELLHQEDQRNLKKILENANHPLYLYLTSQRKIRTTRHNFQSSKPYVRTKAFLNCFTNRVLPF